MTTTSERPRPKTDDVNASQRDPFVDGLRAACLFVVVAWHWVFTVVSWHHGPHTGNPIGSTPGLWALTWVLQVMPLFFWVGGFAHLRTWESTVRASASHPYREFYRRRLARLLQPALVCLALAMSVRVIAGVLSPGTSWLTPAMLVVLSPLWFLGVYLGLVLISPVAIAAHRRYGEVVPVVLAGAACLVDVLRFRYHVPAAGWLNFCFVWAFAHQLGFFYPRLVRAGRRIGVVLALGGLFALFGLTNMGLYPGSMVGVPGQAISNMGPPTICIVALCVLQVGVAICVRPLVEARLGRQKARRLVAWASRQSMTVFLWHFVGFALAYGLLWEVGLRAPQVPSAGWWLERPVYAVVPALLTAPMIRAFGRFDRAARSATRRPPSTSKPPFAGVGSAPCR
jgi:peptidoglycan/LPS O-acetylase OafA/YrhL